MSLLKKLQQPIGGSSKKKVKEKPDMATGGYPNANLMPASHREKKDKEEVKRLWMKIFPLVLLAAAVMIGAAFGWAQYQSYLYDQKAEEERASEEMLEEYSEYDDILNEVTRIDGVSDSLVETAVDWNALISEIEDGLPSSSRLTSVTILSGPSEGESPAVVVQATISAVEALDYADVIYSIPGTTSTELGNMTGSGEEYIYNVSFGFNEEMLAHYEEEDAEGEDAGDSENDAEPEGAETDFSSGADSNGGDQ